MPDKNKLDVGFMTEVAARLAGRHWPTTALEQLTQGAGQGLISGLDDLMFALQRLGVEDFVDVAPGEGPFRGAEQ